MRNFPWPGVYEAGSTILVAATTVIVAKKLSKRAKYFTVQNPQAAE